MLVSICYTVCTPVSGASLFLEHPSPNRTESIQDKACSSVLHPLHFFLKERRKGIRYCIIKIQFREHKARDFLVSCGVIFFLLRKVASVL